MPQKSQGFYSLTRTSRRRYFWVVWRSLKNFHEATDPDVYGFAVSRDEALQRINTALNGVDATNLENAFAQHWQKILAVRNRIKRSSSA